MPRKKAQPEEGRNLEPNIPEELKPAVERLVTKGREQGFVTQQEVLQAIPQAEAQVARLDDLYSALLAARIKLSD